MNRIGLVVFSVLLAACSTSSQFGGGGGDGVGGHGAGTIFASVSASSAGGLNIGGSQPTSTTTGPSTVGPSGSTGSTGTGMPGCMNPAGGDFDRMLTVGSDQRLYHLHVPQGLAASDPTPLVLGFHGGGHTAAVYETMTHLKDKSDEAKFLLVEADGLGALGPASNGVLETWNGGNCCEDSSKNNVDDVGFVNAILDDVATQACLDPKRVFSTGFSNGGMLSHRLACQLYQRIAAIAAVSGGNGDMNLDVMPPQAYFDCQPNRPMPILHIHGTKDACYPFAGGYGPLSMVTFEPVQKTVDDWATRNGCAATAPKNVYSNGAASCVQYDCPAPGDVTFCTIEGGGHYWPGGDDWAGSEFFCGFTQGIRSADLKTNDFIWEYFKAHPMP